MSNELINQNEFTLQLKEFELIQETCKKLLSTKHYQNLGEAGIHAILARSKALGIHPFEALNSGFYVVQGRVGMSTEMMAALVRKRGHSITKDPKSNNEICILHGKRADTGDTWTCSFSKVDAEAAGLWNGPTWKKYSGVMLYNRAMSMLFRQLFPDLSMGAGYVEDELKEIAKVDEYKLPVTECEVATIPSQNKDATILSQNRDELIIQLGEILEVCGTDYENKICEYYKIKNISGIPDTDLPKVIQKALAFRELKMKQQESKE